MKTTDIDYIEPIKKENIIHKLANQDFGCEHLGGVA